MKIALTVIATLVAFTGAGHADRIKVAVVPGMTVNLDPARVDALSQDLAGALVAALDIDAVGGLEVRRKLPAEGLAPDCLTTPACVADVAGRLGASQLLFVVMVDATGSGAVQIDSTWIEPATGKSTSRPVIDVRSISEAKTRFLEAAQLLLPDAPVRPKPETGIGGTMTKEVPRHFSTPAIISAGAAVIGIGVGIGFGLSARSKYRDCDALGTCNGSQRDAIRTKTLIADAGFLVGLAGVIATSVFFATSGKESRLVVSLTGGPSPDGVSLAAVGRF